MQGDRQAAAVRLGDEVDGAGVGGGAEPAVLELHAGAMGSVLVEGRSLGVPRRRLNGGRAGRASGTGGPSSESASEAARLPLGPGRSRDIPQALPGSPEAIMVEIAVPGERWESDSPRTAVSRSRCSAPRPASRAARRRCDASSRSPAIDRPRTVGRPSLYRTLHQSSIRPRRAVGTTGPRRGRPPGAGYVTRSPRSRRRSRPSCRPHGWRTGCRPPGRSACPGSRPAACGRRA